MNSWNRGRQISERLERFQHQPRAFETLLDFITIASISYETALNWTPVEVIDHKSILDQEMERCCQAVT